MLVLHYYEGPSLSDELRQAAQAVRDARGEYHFRDEKMFTVVERCDAVVSTKDSIVEAYKAVGIGAYKSVAKEAAEARPKVKPKSKGKKDDGFFDAKVDKKILADTDDS